MLRRMAVVTMVLLVTAASSASAAVSKGATLLGIQLSSGTADLYDPNGAGQYLSAYDHSETGVQVQCWKMYADDYAMALAGGIGWFSETQKPGPDAGTGAPEFKYSQSSWRVRLGGDRVARIGDRALVYFGPGVEFWSGKARFEGGGPTLETESVSRISLDGRAGGIMTIGSGWGLALEVGNKIGHASAKDEGAETTWWPSSFEASGGLVFLFGK